MNAIRVILAVLATLVMDITLNPNSASAQNGYEFTCHDANQVYNFVTCGTCAPCSAGPSTAQLALHNADQAITGVTNLGEQLKRANSALASLRRSKANQATVDAIEQRVTRLESEMQTSCASIHDVARAAPCWEAFKLSTGQTQLSMLGVMNNAFMNGVPVNGTLAMGKTAITPELYIHLESPADTTPAFAQVRKDRVAPASEYTNEGSLWPYIVVPATTTLAGLAIGYGYGDDGETTNSTDAFGRQTSSFKEGNKVETSLIGGGIGLVSGLGFNAIYYLMTRPDPVAR